jgi:hypothetical protein
MDQDELQTIRQAQAFLSQMILLTPTGVQRELLTEVNMNMMAIIDRYKDDGVRFTGRSTRIVDSAVQALFREGKVKLIDHVPKATRNILPVMIDRLRLEHGVDPHKDLETTHHVKDGSVTVELVQETIDYIKKVQQHG